jgi:hypothetical protein
MLAHLRESLAMVGTRAASVRPTCAFRRFGIGCTMRGNFKECSGRRLEVHFGDFKVGDGFVRRRRREFGLQHEPCLRIDPEPDAGWADAEQFATHIFSRPQAFAFG